MISILADSGAAESLRVRAHAAILREEFEGDGREELLRVIDKDARPEFEELLRSGSADDELVTHFSTHFTGPAELDSGVAARILTRTVAVGGAVLGGIKRGRPVLGPLSLAMRSFGRLTSGALGLVDRVKRLFRRR